MTIFGKRVSEYITFQKGILWLIVIVALGRFALSVAGVPNSTVKWLSVTAVALLGLVYYAIRVHTTGFGSYKQLLPLLAIQSLLANVLVAGYRVHLANTAAIQQYSGLKYSDDNSDAAWLAHLLRLGLLPEGHIYPKETRAVRDLLRKRGQLVRQRTRNILSIENLTSRNQGVRIQGNSVKRLSPQEVESQYENQDLALAVTSTLSIVEALNGQIGKIEQRVKETVGLAPSFERLKTVSGIGEILALTIMLEAGNLNRFPSVGDFSSYCRCVSSEKLSNGKRKGSGNVKNGNAYLSWAFIEAAHFAIRHDPVIRRFYQRKQAKTLSVVALKAVAHKLARACYYVMRDQVPFEVEKCFGH